jgi:hypothetical protein
MALAAGGMALTAVIIKSLVNRRAFGNVPAPDFKSVLHSTYRVVKTVLVDTGNILMAGIATYPGWVDYQPRMGAFFVIDSAIAAVTDNTADLAMSALHEIGIFQKDLFPHLQRRQLAASAFP